jgi:hypothetical protein
MAAQSLSCRPFFFFLHWGLPWFHTTESGLHGSDAPVALPGVPELGACVAPIANLAAADRAALRWDAAAGRVGVDWARVQPHTVQTYSTNTYSHNDNGMFHTDHAFLAEPAAATLLLPVALPAPEGAGLETELVSLAAARRELPASLARAVAGRAALHCYGPGLLDAWMAEHAGEPPPRRASRGRVCH